MKQLFRYALVGIATNLAGYLMYLLVTALGLGPKQAMSGLYLVGVTLSYFGNRRWTFGDHGNVAGSAVRFAFAHLLGYLLNFAILVVFVDRLGYPHQWVQGVAIFVVALFLFALFRAFVFRRAAIAGGHGR